MSHEIRTPMNGMVV
ncbi:MAG: hypothetical protein ACLVLH_13420 [Eisenbergiella massiliensis]